MPRTDSLTHIKYSLACLTIESNLRNEIIPHAREILNDNNMHEYTNVFSWEVEKKKKNKKWRGWDLNPHPMAYESTAPPLSYLARCAMILPDKT